MPVVDERRWTAAEVRAMPTDHRTRVECVDGALLVSAAPSRVHQLALWKLVTLLTDHVRDGHRAAVLSAPMDYELDPFTVVQPDISVFPTPLGRAPRRDEENEPPVLFVEILSPSTARHDRVVKRERYQREGIEYWIVDCEARVFERWMPGESRPFVESDRVTWRLVGHQDELHIGVADYFAQVWGEV